MARALEDKPQKLSTELTTCVQCHGDEDLGFLTCLHSLCRKCSRQYKNDVFRCGQCDVVTPINKTAPLKDNFLQHVKNPTTSFTELKEQELNFLKRIGVNPLLLQHSIYDEYTKKLEELKANQQKRVYQKIRLYMELDNRGTDIIDDFREKVRALITENKEEIERRYQELEALENTQLSQLTEVTTRIDQLLALTGGYISFYQQVNSKKNEKFMEEQCESVKALAEGNKPLLDLPDSGAITITQSEMKVDRGLVENLLGLLSHVPSIATAIDALPAKQGDHLKVACEINSQEGKEIRGLDYTSDGHLVVVSSNVLEIYTTGGVRQSVVKHKVDEPWAARVCGGDVYVAGSLGGVYKVNLASGDTLKMVEPDVQAPGQVPGYGQFPYGYVPEHGHHVPGHGYVPGLGQIHEQVHIPPPQRGQVPGVEVDNGRIYFTDFQNGLVYSSCLNSRVAKVWSHETAEFMFPSRLCMTRDSKLAVCVRGRVIILDQTGRTKHAFSRDGYVKAFCNDICCDSKNRLLVCDKFDHKVFVLSAACKLRGELISTKQYNINEPLCIRLSPDGMHLAVAHTKSKVTLFHAAE